MVIALPGSQGCLHHWAELVAAILVRHHVEHAPGPTQGAAPKPGALGQSLAHPFIGNLRVSNFSDNGDIVQPVLGVLRASRIRSGIIPARRPGLALRGRVSPEAHPAHVA
jgi:hypothetical protein